MTLAGTICLVSCTDAPAPGAAGESRSRAARLEGEIKIDGSSTVYPITEAVAEEFRKVAPRVNVTVGVSGTGGGFKRFTKNDTDISDASRPIKDSEFRIARENKVEFIEIPVAYDGLTIVVNHDNTWATSLTVDDLRKIFLDGTMAYSWKDVNASYPDVPIKIYAPGTDSGTFDYFKEVVAGKAGTIRSDMSVSEDDNVLVRGVMGDQGAIGFFGCSYYFEYQDKLRAVAIVNPATTAAVIPTTDTIEDGTYAPFSRPLLIYVNAVAAKRPEVKAFVEFYLRKAPELVTEVKYVQLPKAAYDLARANLKGGVTGTYFMDDTMEKRSGALGALFTPEAKPTR
ncbi:MAG: PstS family phosphate ABC transporter substrate-binding protein [Phycisphaerales bacterium]|nr:PstS family phosphate ABC transporter substrate-binding protein [Phycisphaerales bacterium]